MNKSDFLIKPSGKDLIKVMRYGDVLARSRRYDFVFETADSATIRNMIINGGCCSSHLYNYSFDTFSRRLTAVNKISGRLYRYFKVKDVASLLKVIPNVSPVKKNKECSMGKT